MHKIISLDQLIKLLPKAKLQGKKVGFITGCFDILHAGHVELLRFAKSHCDILVIGLENDATIKLSKGSDRPIHDFFQRSLIMSELSSVDFIFEIPITVKFGTSESIKNEYVKMTMKIKPDYLFTTPVSDKYWQEKKSGADEIGAQLLTFESIHQVSTSSIAEKLKHEL